MKKEIEVMIPLDDIIHGIKGLKPDEVFSYDDLREWALNNGFIEET